MNRNHMVNQIADKIWLIDEFGLNTMYIIEGSNRALVIDTGTGVADFMGIIESLISLPYDVVATHAHVDHIGGRGQFDTIFMHSKDFEQVSLVTLEARRNYAANFTALNGRCR